MPDTGLVGIISDTHDNRGAIIAGVRLFNERGCGLVIHAGDIVAPFTAREFGKLTGKLVGVYGNNDGEHKGLALQFAKFGEIHKAPYEFSWCGRKFALMHEPFYLDRYLKSGAVDVVIYGHTHEIDIREGTPLVINPGEGCAWLTGRATAAILDCRTLGVEIVELET